MKFLAVSCLVLPRAELCAFFLHVFFLAYIMDDNFPRKVIVHYGSRATKGPYGSQKSRIGKKNFILPAISQLDRKSDLEVLQEKILKEIVVSPYLQKELGGSESTKMEDISIYLYEECFSQPEEFLLSRADVLCHKEENLVAIISKLNYFSESQGKNSSN